jgi:hypothetical protein
MAAFILPALQGGKENVGVPGRFEQEVTEETAKGS